MVESLAVPRATLADPAGGASGRPRTRFLLLTAALYLIGFFFLSVFGDCLAVPGEMGFAAPAAGLLLALLLKFGWSATPLAVATQFAAAMAPSLAAMIVPSAGPPAPPPDVSALLLAAATPSLSYAGTVWAAARCRLLPLRANLRGVLTLCAIAGIGSTTMAMVTALIDVARTTGAGRGDYAHAVATCAIGDLVGIFMLTPLLLPPMNRSLRGWWTRCRAAFLGANDGERRPARFWRGYRRRLALGLPITVAALVAFAFASPNGLLSYLLFLPVVWAALSFGLPLVTVMVAVMNIAVAAIIALRDFVDPLPGLPMFMVVISMTGLAMGAVVSELRGERQVLRRLLRQRTQGLAAEIGRRQEAEAAALREGERAQQFLTIARTIILALDANGRVTLINPEGCRVLGHARSDLIHRDFFDLVAPPADQARLRTLYRRYLEDKDGRPMRRHGAVQTGDGQRRIIDWRFVGIRRDGGGEVTGVLCSGNDVTERVLAKQRIEYLANHDGLTGLPNRRWLCEALNGAVARAKRHRALMAILFVDLDGFKPVNDRFGHAAGDAVLLEVARRLKSLLRATDVAARFGGDEFVVVIEDLAIPAAAGQVAAKLLAALSWPIEIAGDSVRLGASIGIAVYPADGEDGETLLRAADRAMYRIKNATPGRYGFAGDKLAPSRFEGRRLAG